MGRATRKPVELEWHRWHKVGDHPEDIPGRPLVRPFASIDLGKSGAFVHERCGRTYSDHGRVLTLEGDVRVCPGDAIMTGVDGEHWPVAWSIFLKTYSIVES